MKSPEYLSKSFPTLILLSLATLHIVYNTLEMLPWKPVTKVSDSQTQGAPQSLRVDGSAVEWECSGMNKDWTVSQKG
jgi:hypothetical protein